MAKFEVTINGQPTVVEAADENEAVQKALRPQATPLQERGTGILTDIDAAVRGAADVATFGYMDEIASRLGALTGIGGKQGDVEGNLALQRATDKFDEEHNPWARTAGQVAGGVAQAVAAPIPRAAGFLPGVVQGVAEGGIQGALYGTGSAEGDPTRRLLAAPDAALNGALWGGGAAAAMPLVGRAVGAGADMLGIGPPAPRAPGSIGDEFGVDMRRGQLPGAPVSQAQLEEDILNGAKGDWARDFLQQHATRQQQQVQDAGGRIAQDFNNPPPAPPQPPSGAPQLTGPSSVPAIGYQPPAPAPRPVATRNVNELGNIALDNVTGAAATARQGIDQAYGTARAAGGALIPEAINAAPQRVRQILEQSGLQVNQLNTPLASELLQQLDEFGNLGGILRNEAQFTQMAPGDRIAGVTLDGVEQMRSLLTKAQRQAPSPRDREVLGNMVGAFDTWLDDAVDGGLLAGDQTAVELFRRARAQRREYGSRFESNPRQADDDAGRLIERMIQKDVTGNEVVNAIVGTAKAGANGTSTRIVRRLQNVMGADSPEFGQIRQLAWERMLQNSSDTGQAGPQAVATEIRRTLEGKGADYGRALFTAEQRALMLRYANLLEATAPRPGTYNNSRTGGVAARALQAAQTTQGMIMASLLTSLGGAGIGQTVTSAALGGSIGAAATGGASLWNRARAGRATRPLPAPPARLDLPSLAPVRPGAAYGAAAAQDDSNGPLTFRVRPGAR